METKVTQFWKVTSLAPPKDGQECVIYNTCDGYRIATWDHSEGCFYEFAKREQIGPHLAQVWTELPPSPAMSAAIRKAAFQELAYAQQLNDALVVSAE